MAKVKFPQGYVYAGNGLRKSIKSLEDATAEQAKCDACGCDAKLGYTTQIDVQDGTLKMLYVWDGTLRVEDHSTQLIENLKTACRERAAGGSVTDPQVQV